MCYHMKIAGTYYVIRVQSSLLFFRQRRNKGKRETQIQRITGFLDDHLEWEAFAKIKYIEGHRFTTLYFFLTFAHRPWEC